MQVRNKKLLGMLACASALSGIGVVASTQVPTISNNLTAQAAKTSVAARQYGVDVASYQSSDVSSFANAGGQFAIVKVSQGTTYRNPKASSQISSAISNNMMPMAYHFATFGANASAAVAEANYAISSAKALGLPNNSYIACDWETGSGNNVNGAKAANTNAILAFMKQVKQAGYQPLLYSGAYLLRNNINTGSITSQFPNSLWVASYATMGRIDNPDFNYFPSMDGIAIWQFTDNWRGLNVDGNITLLPLSYNSTSTQAPVTATTTNNSNSSFAEQAKPTNNNTTTSSSSEVKTAKTVMHKAYIYDKNGNRVGNSAIGAYRTITVLGGVVQINGKNHYKIGDNQYVALGNVDGTLRTLGRNAYVYNNKGQRVYVPTLRKGSSVKTYGTRVHINGKSYYRINKNRYVKVGNF
ncbi:GH25 family lysozyme [Lactobacillus hamsteri]|uniref:Lysin n=1 Tax=Lactobacillus hamsteri DSM 5661 = JCM 6256 TaxID=1423754 RepID=A0A0R1YFM4_9LACO|nr:SLAP domain-containing protein [Lactobacillus hamsteri]KRM41223.1 lysin [Lactobacillus hamsteri DSM 5661 = JCM 6256]